MFNTNVKPNGKNVLCGIDKVKQYIGCTLSCLFFNFTPYLWI